MNIITKQLVVNDLNEFIQMLRVFEEVFEMKDFQLPDESHLKELLANKNFIVYVALHDNVVVGGLTAHILPSCYSASAEVYLYDVGVKPDQQRKGIGKQLLHDLAEHCRKNRYKGFFVQADEADTHALDFYRSTGGISANVVHFSYLM